MPIRCAKAQDACRIAEIEIFNYRLNFYPIFQNDAFYFDELQVVHLCAQFDPCGVYVYDDGVVKGFIRVRGAQIEKLFVEPVLQGRGIGAQLLEFAMTQLHAESLFALEKNTRAIRFYQRHGFCLTGVREKEPDTNEYLVEMRRNPHDGARCGLDR